MTCLIFLPEFSPYTAALQYRFLTPYYNVGRITLARGLPYLPCKRSARDYPGQLSPVMRDH